ncbi:MAG: ParD-like family protein [Verrucomicrobia bacterium]|nr:ParD-like family protein [Verrucomicrobiota bacterium]
MSQPVKLSDALVLDARLAGAALERSIAGQVEFWARLGRAIEPLLQGTHVLSLCRNAAARPLSACLDSVDSAQGRQRVAGFLQTQPFPHYEPAADAPGLLVRIEADGKRTVGHFVHRRFVAVKPKREPAPTDPQVAQAPAALTAENPGERSVVPRR